MLRIDICNVQAIESASIEFDGSSIVEFTGDNSNGKSILSKFIKVMTSGGLHSKEERISLVRDGCTECYCIFTHNLKQLGVFVGIESKTTKVAYIEDVTKSQSPIVRFLGEGGTEELIHQFGFRSYSDGEICMQLSPTYGVIPFVTSSGTTNFNIVSDIVTDKVADEFIKTYESITYPLFKNRLKNLKSRKTALEDILSNMVDYDAADMKYFADKAIEIAKATNGYVPFRVKNLTPPPHVEFQPVGNYRLKNIPYFGESLVRPKLQSLAAIAEDLQVLRDNKCPTCGRLFIEE